MKPFLLVIMTALLSSCSPAGDVQQAMRDVLADELKTYQAELNLNYPSQFIESFVQEFASYPQVPLSEEEVRKFLPGFLLRGFSDGDYATALMGRYMGTLLVKKVTDRNTRGIPVLSGDELAEKTRLLEQVENQIILSIEQKFQALSLEEMDPAEVQNRKDEIVHRIRLGIGSQKIALYDPTYALAPAAIDRNTAARAVELFDQALSDLLDLSQSDSSLEQKYEGVIRLFARPAAPADSVPQILRIRSRLDAILPYFSALDLGTNPAHFTPKPDPLTAGEREQLSENLERLTQEKEKFTEILNADGGFPAITEALQQRIDEYFIK